MEPVGAVGGLVFVGIVLVLSQVIATAMNRGVVYGGEPDPNVLRATAQRLQLDYLPRDQGILVSGAHNGAHIGIDARWWRASHRNRWRGKSLSWQVQTTVRASFGVPMPQGLHLRRQTAFAAFADALVSGDEIKVDDKQFDAAFIIHGTDVDAIGRVLAPRAREALLRLARVGDVWVDEHGIRLILGKYLAQHGEVSGALDLIAAAVEAMRLTAPAIDDRTRPVVPIAMLPKRRGLTGLIKAADSLGGQLTSTGRAAHAALAGMPCELEVDVEHVVPHHTASGRPDGVTVAGILRFGTGRVDVHLIGPLAEALAGVAQGDRLRCDGPIVMHDAMRDRTEVTADHAEIIGIGTVPVFASPIAARIDLALGTDVIDEILPVLYVGREARERMVAGLTGRTYTLRGAIVQARPTPTTRASSPAYHRGLTVEIAHPAAPRPVAVRFPADRTEWLEQLAIGADLEVDAVFTEWDELADHAVFEERGA